MIYIQIIETILFVLVTINVAYLLFFGVASHLKFKYKPVSEIINKRIAVLIPAYKEDRVILECVDACLQQSYPRDKYDIIVISDQMEPQTNAALSALPVLVVEVFFKNSTKAKALNYAMSKIEMYDIALILDADNTMEKDFLKKINNAFQQQGEHIVQAHRTAKNLNTNLAILDAVSEEINNSIFRLGHANVGLSAALIGSGMAFTYGLLKERLAGIDAVGGFDRALELSLILSGKKIEYLPDAWVLDEKVQRYDDFSRQRRRWLSAQIHYMTKHIGDIPQAIRNRNWDFCDKVFQQMSMPRVMLLGFICIIAFVLLFVSFAWAVKWWIVCAILNFTFYISTPRSLKNKRLLLAITELPYSFALMFFNLFKLRGANKKFIHTSHGVEK